MAAPAPGPVPAPLGPVRAMGAAEWGTLLALSVLWGGSFLFIGVAVRELPPLTLVLLRVALAALALHAALRVLRVPFPTARPVLLAFLGMGLLNNVVPFILLVWGQARVPSGLASILNATTPLFTVLAASALTRDEPLTASKLAGVAFGLAGAAVMVGPQLLGGRDSGGREMLLGELACVAAALAYGVAGVFGRRFARLGVAPLAVAAGQVTASTLVLAPLALLVDRPWTQAPPSAGAWAAVLALAIVSTAFAYVLFFRLLARAGATNISLVTLLVPVTAVLLGALVLGERLEARHAAGFACIAAGLAFVDGRLPRRLADRLGRARLTGPRGRANR